jgi:spore germination protein YaaH
VVKYAAQTMPGDKILLGIPAYGNEWAGVNSNNMQWSRTLIWKNIAELNNYGQVQWHNGHSAPYIVYNKNNLVHEAWFENQYSLNIKLNLVKKYQLAGTALWKLGLEDDTLWQTINNSKL